MSNHWLDEDAPGQYVRFALSRDLGETWTDPTSPSAVLFPPMDVARQNTDRRYDKSKEFYTMCANGYAVVNNVLYAIAEPSRGINNPVKRDPLTLALARDGRTFSEVALINHGAGQNRHPGRAKVNGYQYPHSAVGAGFLFVLYSANKEDVYFTKIPLSDISALLRTKR